MARNQAPSTLNSERKTSGAEPGNSSPGLGELLEELGASGGEIAVANLVCASGLPGAGTLAIERYLEWLDAAAAKVKLATDRNYYKFLDAPGKFKNSQARFCMVCLVTALQQQCGVRYNPKWQELTPDRAIPRAFGIDAGDLFIHAIIDGVGGTCSSLPVLYIAVGRRLGYPLRLVKAARHLFVRWDDLDGKHWHQRECFNVEATGPGVHFLPDEHYRTWPHAISDGDIEAGIFLRSLSHRDEFAEFAATRGYCLQGNGQLDEAVNSLAEASRLAPHNRYFAASCQALRLHIEMRRRGHAFVNAPVPNFTQQSVGPFWIDGLGGRKMLVQIVSPVTQPYGAQPDLGLTLPLVREHLQTPNGNYVEAWLPMHCPSSPMTAHWVRLTDGRLALIHVPKIKGPAAVDQRGHLRVHDDLDARPGCPIVPRMQGNTRRRRPGLFLPGEEAEMPAHEQAYLASRIPIALAHEQDASSDSEPPLFQSLAIPPGSCMPALPMRGLEIFLTS